MPRDESSIFGMSQRLLPRNEQAEQALLGAILANNRAYDSVVEFLRPEHFADPVHSAIYRVAVHVIEGGGVADPLTLRRHFENNGRLDEVGGMSYLALLLSAMVGIMNAGEYGRAIYEAWQRREVIASISEAIEQAFDGSVPLTEILRTLAGVDEVVTGSASERGPVSLGDAVDLALASADRAGQRGGPVGLSTGVKKLDELIGGLEDGTLTVLAGATGMGKSAAGAGIGINAAVLGAHTLFLSLEMSVESLGRRALAAAANVPALHLKRGWHEQSVPKLLAGRKALLDLPLYIDDGAGMTTAVIAAKARKFMRKVGALDLIVVDHLQIVGQEETDKRQGQTFAIGNIANMLKQMAKKFDCPVLLLAQLSRDVGKRDDKRPILADLKQSGDIENAADNVIFVYRPEYYLPQAAPDKNAGETADGYAKRLGEYHASKEKLRGKAEWIVAKARDGELGLVNMEWNGPTTSFTEVGTDQVW